MPYGGETIKASDAQRWYVKASQSATQSIASSATFTALTFNVNDTDNLGTHNTVTNNTRFVLGLKLGWWLCNGKYVTAATAASTSRRCRFIVNGTTGVNGGYQAYPTFTPASGFWTVDSTTMVQTTVSTDYVEFQGYQDTGGAQSTTVSGDLRCEFTAIYLGP